MSTYRAVRDIEDALADGSVVVSDPAVLTQVTAIEENTNELTNALESNDADRFLVRLDKIGSTAVDVGNGSQGLGTQRVILADDQDPVSVTFTPLEVAGMEDPMGVGQKSSTGYSIMNMGGFRDLVPGLVGTGTGIGNGWDINQIPEMLSTGDNAEMFIISTDGDDDLVGDGAQRISWGFSLDSGSFGIAIDDTDGMSAIGTGQAAKVVRFMKVLNVGTDSTNAGVVSLVSNAAPSSTEYWARIAINEGIAYGSNFKVPILHDLHLVKLTGHASEVIVILVECTNHEGAENIETILLKIRVHGHFYIDLRHMETLDALTQLRMTAWSIATEGALTCYLTGYAIDQDP